MDQSLASGFLIEVNERIDASRLLHALGYATDKVQVVGDSVKGFCPIHRDTKFRSLVIDGPKHSFKCINKTCPGYAGGTLVDLYALARRMDPTAAASHLVAELGLDVDPGWTGRLVESRIDEAREALARGDSDSAEQAALAALAILPSSVEARLFLAQIYIGQGEPERGCAEYAAAVDAQLEACNFEEADRVLDEAIGAFPESEDLFFLQVRSAELQGRIETVVGLLEELASAREAAGRSVDNIGLYHRLIELQPDNPGHRLRLAAIHESRRDMRTAAREMEKAARQLINQERGAEAIPILEKVLKCEPQQSKLRLLLADELIREGDFTRAREQIFEVANQQIENSEYFPAENTVRRWLDIEPDSLEVYETLARIFQEQERHREAADALRKAAESAVRSGGKEAALPYYFRIKFLQPEDIGLRQELVEKLIGLEQPQRAAFELLDLAEVFFAQDRKENAGAALRRAAEVDSAPAFLVQVAEIFLSHDDGEAAGELLRNASAAAEKTGDTGTALEAYDRLVTLAPDDVELLEQRVRLLWEHGAAAAPAATVSLFDQLTADGRGNDAVNQLEAAAPKAAAVSSSEAAEAFCRLFDLALEHEKPEEAGAFYSALAASLRNRDPQSVLEKAERLLEFDPQKLSVRRDIADLYHAIGRGDNAAQAYLELAAFEEERGETEAALNDLDRAASVAPERVEILKRKASLVERVRGTGAASAVYQDYLLRLRNVVSAEEAFREYENYLERSPGDTIARRQYADLMVEQGRGEEAEAIFRALLKEAEASDDTIEVLHLRERLLALSPGDPSRQSSLAAALLEAGDARRAFGFYCSAARAHAAAGEAGEAIRTAREALQIDPQSTDTLEILAEAAAQLGDQATLEEALLRLAGELRDNGYFDDAIEQFERLVELCPDNADYRAQSAEALELAGENDAALTEWKALAGLHEKDGNPGAALEIYTRLGDRIVSDPEALRRWNILAEGQAGTPADRVLATAAMATSHLAAGDMEGAEKSIGVLTALAPHAPQEAASRLLHLAEKLGDPTAAGAAYLAAAHAFLASGKPDQAADIMLLALAADPDNAIAREALATFLESTGRDEEAFEHRLSLLRAALADAESAAWQQRLSELRERGESDPRRRLQIAQVLLTGDGAGTRRETMVELEAAARAATASGNEQLVLDACDAAPAVAAVSPLLRAARTDILVASGRTGEAGSWLRFCAETALSEEVPEDADEAVARWLQLAPSDPEALETAALVHARLDRPDQAVEACLAAAAIWRSAGEYSNAARALRAASAWAGDNLAPRQLLWQVLLEGGELKASLAEMHALAGEYAQRGESADAIRLLERVLEHAPDLLEAVEFLARLVQERDGFDAALPHYRRALLLHRRDGTSEQVNGAYEAILRLKGASLELRAEYADFLEETGQDEEAKRQLLLVARACRDEQRDFVRAIEYFGRATALSHSPEDAPVFEDLAALHLELKVPAFAAGAMREAARLYDAGGKPQAAIQCARHALELSEGSQRIEDLTLLGTMLVRGGKVAEGAALLHEAIEAAAADPSTTVERRRELCSALLEADPSDFATAEKYLELLPGRELPECAVALSRRFGQSGHPDNRMRLLKLAKVLAPASLTLRSELVDVLLESGADQEKLQRELVELCELAARVRDLDVATDALKRLEKMPEASGSPLLLAPLYALIDDTDTAVAKYAAAAEALAAEELIEDAAEALRAAIELDASSVPASSVATVIRHSSGAPQLRTLAERQLNSAIRARSRTRALVIATALLENSDREQRDDILKRIAAGAGAAFVVAVAGAHADWLEERDRSDEAGRLADFVTELVPNSPDAWWLASQLHRKAGRSQPSADAALKAARLFNEAGAVTEEESCYREALEQFPNDIPVLETLAFFYDREKRVGDALEVMRRLAELTGAAGNHNASANWLRRVVGLAPQDETAREQFAEALVRLNRMEEAGGQYFEIARTYARRGNDEKAEEMYQRLLSVEPDNEQAAAYLLDRATRLEDTEGISRYTIAVATAKAESGALNQACQLLRNLLVRDPDNLEALEKLAAFAHRAQDDQTFHSATQSLGQKLIAKQDYMGAIIQYEALLENHPQDLEVLQVLVDCCAHEGMAERGADFALQMLDRAREVADMRRMVSAANAVLSYDPAQAGVRRELAEALLCLNRIPHAVTEWQQAAEEFVTQGDLASAAECFRRITQVTPENLAAWKRLADVLAFGDQPAEARTAYLHLAGVYAETGDIAAAIAVLRRLGDLDPEDGLPHERALALHLSAGQSAAAFEEILWLVRFHIRKGDLTAAERLVEQGVSIDPESLILQQCRLEIVRGLGRTDELRIRMRELAERFKAAGDLARAADTLEQVLQTDANQPDVRRELGGLLLKLGQTTRAHEHFSRLLQEVLENADPEEARDAAESILSAHSDDTELRARLAQVFTESGLQEIGGRYYAICAGQAAEAGDTIAQVRYLKLATQARPRWAEGLRSLGDACAASGDATGAFDAFEKLGGLLIEAKQIPDAAAALQRQISLKPKDPRPRVQLADLYGRIGDRENRATTLQGLADLYVSRGQTDEAVDVYRQLIELRPDEPELLKRFIELFAQVGNELEIVDEYLRLAEALTRRGAFVEATQTYEQILAIDRRNPSIREKFINFLQTHGQKGRALAEMRRLADTYVGRGNKASAINVLVNALAMSPRDAELCLRLAQAYEQAGNHEASMQSYARAASLLSDTAPVRAIDLYTKILEKDPQNTELRRRLAEAYARAGEQSRAASQARRLAEVHASRGELEQAEAAYRMASANRPESLSRLREAAQLHAHDPMLQHVDLIRYGDALMEAGHTDEALDQYRKARCLSDDNPRLIQKCIDALCQIAPEREAVPDMLVLAEKYMMAGDAPNARAMYERVLRLDPACENAKAGRDAAFKMELLSATRSGSPGGAEHSDHQPLRGSRTPKKARVGMSDLLGALEETPPEETPANGHSAS